MAIPLARIIEARMEARVLTLCRHGHVAEAAESAHLMVRRGACPSVDTLRRLLRACAGAGAHALAAGRRIHGCILRIGGDFRSNTLLGNALINMYAKCGSLLDARRTFESMLRRDVFSWTTLILAHAKEGRGEEALVLFRRMQHEGITPNEVTFVGALQACAAAHALEEGERLHVAIKESGFERAVSVGNALVDMYTKCGRIDDARNVFNSMCERDVVSWNAMIMGYARCRRGDEALAAFEEMQQDGVTPDAFTFVAALQAARLETGRRIHAALRKSGLESNVFVANSLIHMYMRCGGVDDARQVFDGMQQRSAASWNAMITGYAHRHRGHDALALLGRMQSEGGGGSSTKPSEVTLVGALKACASLASLACGKCVHALVAHSGFGSNVFVGSTLVDMYAKCGRLEEARQTFDRMRRRNTISWNAMITGYTHHHGHGKEVLALFEQMQREGVKPDQVTLVGVLKACASLTALEQGKQVHASIKENGLNSINTTMASTLIDMYAKCGRVDKARQVFDLVCQHDVVSWNSMIAGYAQHGHGKEALALFGKMQQDEGMTPDEITFTSLLKACAASVDLEQGKMVHMIIEKNGFGLNVVVGNALVDMYVKCGSLDEARQVFGRMHSRDTVSWNAMIAGCSQHGCCEEALTLFENMQSEGVKPNGVTLTSMLKACSGMADLKLGKQVHASVGKDGLELDVILGNTLVDMYAKCGSIENSRLVFEKMPRRDVVTWNVMIAGYAQHGYGKQALSLFKKMEQEGMKPNEVTFASALKSCASLAALEQGKEFHTIIKKYGLELDVFVGKALVDMYAKCGSIEDARLAFDGMRERDVVSWNAMIAGYAQHGHGKEALALFEKMQSEGVKPDEATFVSVLSACNHEGLVDEAHRVFESMCHDHDIRPTVEHYACIAGLLCRLGRLAEAEDFINKMPVQPTLMMWRALLGACGVHGNVELGSHAFEHVLKLDSKDAAAYVVLSNIYAAVGGLEQVAKLRKEMEDDARRVKKIPAG